MKKTFSICICMLLYIMVFADDKVNQEYFIQDVVMQLTDNKEKIFIGQHKGPARIPKVSYDSQHLYIIPHYNVSSAHVIIRDDNDNIIYDIYTTLAASGSVIMPPKDIMENKCCIELIYSEKSYTGIF